MVNLVFMFTLLAFAASAGFIGALFGLGGGIVIVPVLTVFFHLPIKEAVAVSIVGVVATSTAGGSRYVEQGITNVRLSIFLEVATTLGALTGAFLTLITPSFVLFFLLAALLFSMSILQIKTSKVESEKIREDKFMIAKEDFISKKLSLAGGYYDEAEKKTVKYGVNRSFLGFSASYFAGVVSALLGIGGGVLKVPFMNQIMNVPIKVAVATSKFMIGVTASTAALLYFFSGLVDLVTVTPVVLGITLGAITGTLAMNKIRVRKLKLAFGLLLLYFSYLMIAKGVYAALGLRLVGV